jgi:hypothetical protein
MSNNEKFDEFVKKRFSNSSPEVPSHIWENIIAERAKKPKAFWWGNLTGSQAMLAGLAVFVGCLSITWLLIHHSYDSNKKISAVVSVQQNNNNITTTNNNSIKQTALSPSSVNPSAVKNNSSVQSTGINNSDVTINNSNHLNKHHNIINSKMVYAESIDENSSSDNREDKKSTLFSQSQPLNHYTDKVPGLLAILNTNYVLKSSSAHNITLPECPTVEKQPSRSRDYIEFYGSPDYGMRTMTDAADPQYLKSRDSSSAFSSAYSFGIRYTKVFNNGLSLRGGLNYSQINEWFTPAKNNIITYTVNPTTHDTTYTYKVSRNHYSSIDIPLTIGYEFAMGPRFFANVNAGLIVNVFSWQNGDVLDTSNNTIHITSSSVAYSPYLFRSVIGAGITGNISVYYKLTDYVSVFAEPYCRYNFQPMTQNVSSFTEKYTTVGLHLGVRLDLH